MKKIDIYIIKKFLGTFFYAIALLAMIVIIFDISEKIDDFFEKQAPLKEIIFSYYLNFIPYFINMFSALFTFIAVIFFTSKMAGNTEIIAILNSGISFNRMLRPYLIAATFLALMSFTLTNFVIPHTSKTMLAFEKKYIKDVIRNKDVNIHMQLDSVTYAYMESYNTVNNMGYRFSMEKINENGLYFKLNADYMRWDSVGKKWQIENCNLRTFDGLNEKMTFRQKIDTILPIQPSDFTINLDNLKTMTYSQLREFIHREKMRGSMNVRKFQLEQHKRIAFPFATIILTLIGVSLSSRKVRGGIGLHLGLGITISFAFILFMQISSVFASFGNLPPVIAAWLPNIVFGLLSIYLLRTAPK